MIISISKSREGAVLLPYLIVSEESLVSGEGVEIIRGTE